LLIERAGLKSGAYNSEARNTGKMPVLQNRNAPRSREAHYFAEVM